MALIIEFLYQVAQTLLVVAVAPGVTGLVRWVKARLQRRRGPPLVQVYRNLARLLRKEVALADNSSWVYRVAPYLVFSTVWTAASLVPAFSTQLLFGPAADLIALVALLASARFILALAALDIGTSFGGLGASREMMIASLAEPAMLMIVFVLSLSAGTTHLPAVAEYMTLQPIFFQVQLVLAAIAMIIVAIAENARIPVDNPATHLELTMVHEAMVLEYSGRHLALIEATSSVKLVLYLTLFSCLFVPWGMAPTNGGPVDLAIGLGTWLVKLGVGAVALALFETCIAKMRLFRLGDLIGGGFLFGLLGVILMFVFGSL
ncbi:Formate hydrogenlyase [uncultured Gammaproteobacteria bacterium]